MKGIKVFVSAFVAMLVFGAVGANSAAALLFLTHSATELFLVLNLNTAAKPALLETAGGNKVECPSVLGDGLLLNKTDLAAKALLTLHKCTFAGMICTSAGEPNGLITTLELDALLVTLLDGKYGLVLLAEKGNLAEFTCGGVVSFSVAGTVAGEYTEGKTESEVAKLESKLEFTKGAKAGEPGIKDYWTLEGIVDPKLTSTLTGLLNERSESNMQAVLEVVTHFSGFVCHTPS